MGTLGTCCFTAHWCLWLQEGGRKNGRKFGSAKPESLSLQIAPAVQGEDVLRGHMWLIRTETSLLTKATLQDGMCLLPTAAQAHTLRVRKGGRSMFVFFWPRRRELCK